MMEGNHASPTAGQNFFIVNSCPVLLECFVLKLNCIIIKDIPSKFFGGGEGVALFIAYWYQNSDIPWSPVSQERKKKNDSTDASKHVCCARA